MPIYEQIPIRLAVSLASNPPVAPIDANTGLPPQMWRAQSASIALGIFDAFGNPVDLSNLAQLQFILQKGSADLVPLVVKTYLSTDPNWRSLITTNDWVNGLNQNELALFTSADTDQGLDGAANADFWLIVQGTTTTGNLITYVAGVITLYNASSALPIGPSSYVSLHTQTNTLGDSTVTPTSQQHTEVITIGGAARTSNLIIGNSGVVAGAVMNVELLLPVTTNILINVFSVSLTGPQVFPISVNTSSGIPRALLKMYFDGANWQPLEATLPAY